MVGGQECYRSIDRGGESLELKRDRLSGGEFVRQHDDTPDMLEQIRLQGVAIGLRP